jgi:hypothetical protein
MFTTKQWRSVNTVIGFMVLAVALGVSAILATGSPKTGFDHPRGPVFEFFAGHTGVQCELASGGWSKQGWVYCQTTTPARSVSMKPSGRFRVCTGDTCLGNPGVGTPTIAVGHTEVLGPYACHVQHDGVRCTVDGAAGFVMTPSGVSRV